MIDIHSHIIPGVDDGSESMESTVSMINMAVEQGATAFFATPHLFAFLTCGNLIFRRYERMRSHLQKLFPNLKIYLGCEILCRREHMTDIGLGLLAGHIPTMNNTNYVLVEFLPEADWETILFCVSDLRLMGWVPIIAHSERYHALMGRMNTIVWLQDLGCLFQLNVYSLEGSENASCSSWPRQLILERKIDFLGTDMHGFHFRLPSIAQGMHWLEENCAREYLDAIVWKNAEDRLITRKKT